MTIERNDTPYEQQNQVQTMLSSEKELELKEFDAIDSEKQKAIGEELAEKGLELLDFLNSFLENKKIDPKIINDPFAYAEQYVKEQNEKNSA